MEKARFQQFLISTFVIFALCAGGVAHANNFQTETAASARGLGMGDAVINTERGAYSTFYNPANLAAKDTGVNLQPLNFQIDGDDGLAAQLGRRQSINFRDLNSMYQGLAKNPNTYESGRVSLFPNFTVRNFQLGMLYEQNQGAEVNASDGSLRVKARDRFAPTAALSFRLFKGIFRFGASVQYLTVGDVDTTVRNPSAQGSSLSYDKLINSAAGLVSTAGTTVTLPFRFLPSFSAVYRNIGGARFTHSPTVSFGDGRTVPTEKPMLDGAASATVYFAHRLETKWEVDYRDGTNRLQAANRMQHVSFGTEWIFYNALKLRAGMGQGYVSMGIGLYTKRAQLDLAVYSDELGVQLRGQQDHRGVLQFTWEMFK